jgi:starch synthase
MSKIHRILILFYNFAKLKTKNPKLMDSTKVLYISQEITPYLPETEMSTISRFLPQKIQDKGKEIRTFMPKFGTINERRNQLHEVIRLSGMNLIIDDTDHPLIIKVASIQSARMQVYFIDNEDYFQRKHVLKTDDNKEFEDNDERAIFFARGVLETVRKLRWAPDIVHCHGWFSGLVPLYVKKTFKDDPLFSRSKVIYSVYSDDFKKAFRSDFKKKVKTEGITEKDVEVLKTPDFVSYSKLAVMKSDGVIIASKKINPELEKFILQQKMPVLPFQDTEDYVDAYSDFYDQILKIKVNESKK